MKSTIGGAALIVGVGMVVAASILWRLPPEHVVIRQESATAGTVHQVTPERTTPLVSPKRTRNAQVYGDPDTPITIVEFSDFACPFCAQLHPTLTRLVDTYPEVVHWEYRHLPLPAHEHSFAAAVAAECMARLGGADAFWQFAETAFSQQAELAPELFTQWAAVADINSAEFADCQSDPAVAALVESDAQIARILGASGTPFSVVVYEDKSIEIISGAVPYEQLLSLIQK